MNRKLFFGVFIIIFLFLSIHFIYAEESFKNIDIDIRSPEVIRAGSTTSLIIQFYNLNEDMIVTIEDIRVKNLRNETIKEFYVGKQLLPVGMYINQIQTLMEDIPVLRHLKSVYFSMVIELVDKVQEGYIKLDGFEINLTDFYNNPNARQVGENIKIYVEVDFISEKGNFTLIETEDILISEPLPIPRH